MNQRRMYNVNFQVPPWMKNMFNRETMSRKGDKQNPKCIIVPLIITLILAALQFYKQLPPLNIKSPSFWGFLLVQVIIYIFVKTVYVQKRRESCRSHGDEKQ